MKIGIILAAATGLAATPALAQSAAPAGGATDQQAPAAPSASPSPAQSSAQTTATFTPEEIASFAKAATKIGDIQQNTTLDDSQKQVAMAAAVTESGLDVNRFNAMSQAARTDPALQKQMQAALSEAQGGQSQSGAQSRSPAKPAQ